MKKLIIILPIIILLIIIFLLKSSIKEDKLKNLNFSKEALLKMEEKKIKDKVKKYSKTLETALLSDNYIESNFNSYMEIEYKDRTNFIENINKLLNLGYRPIDIDAIYNYLNDNDIEILNNYIENIKDYIEVGCFKIDNIIRYKNYKDNNNKTYEEVIVLVNIGLDNPFYTNVKEVINPNDILVLVNKYHHLSESFIPNNLVSIDPSCAIGEKLLVKEAKDKFMELCNDSSVLGLNIKVSSAYRDYNYQKKLYNNYLEKDINADNYSAKEGYSEHQTGLALDIQGANGDYLKFIDTKEYKWVHDNAHKYGFIIRYTKENKWITGYMEEPWHLRYVGIDVASYIFQHNISFDEYYIKFID